MPAEVPHEQTKSAFVNGKRIYLVKVARAQRVLIWLVLAMLLCNCGGFFALQTVFASLARPGGAAVALVLLTAQIAIAIAAIVQTARLAVASGSSAVAAGIAGVGMLFPVVAIVLLMVINGSANRILQSNGVKVGFFGVSADEMRKLIIGACPECGYDIRGLTFPRCPECGADLSTDSAA